jgi:hypothetical protein
VNLVCLEVPLRVVELALQATTSAPLNLFNGVLSSTSCWWLLACSGVAAQLCNSLDRCLLACSGVADRVLLRLGHWSGRKAWIDRSSQLSAFQDPSMGLRFAQRTEDPALAIRLFASHYCFFTFARVRFFRWTSSLFLLVVFLLPGKSGIKNWMRHRILDTCGILFVDALKMISFMHSVRSGTLLP